MEYCCVVSCEQHWQKSSLSEYFLFVCVVDRDSATGRIHLLTYGCAYTTRSKTLMRSSSSSSSSNEARAPGCQSVSTSMTPLSVLLASINHLEHGLLLSSDDSGRLCHCYTDNCNSAISISPTRFSSWMQAFMCTILLLIFIL